MKKRMLSLLCVLALCLGLLPVTALAAAPSGQVIYVGNENVTSGGYWTTDNDGKVTAVTDESTPADNFIHYDANSNTLTLHNATIKMSVSIDTNTLLAGAAIGVLNQYGDGNAELTITLEGTNTIANVSHGIYMLANSESTTNSSSLTITGDGSLNASAIQHGIWVQHNSCDAALRIENAKVTATLVDSYGGNGVVVQSAENKSASLTVDGGSLTATGSDATYAGIKMQFGSSTSSSGTPTVTVSGNAIVRANGGITDNSSSEIQIGADSNESNGGIVWNGKDGTVYGDVTLQEDITIGEGESLTIGGGASLDTNGKLTVNGGTLNGTPSGGVTYKVTGVNLDQTAISLAVGGTAALNATITPANATNQNLTWSSDNTNVATVASGSVTAVGTGSTNITVTTEDGQYKAVCAVTVTQPVTGVSLNTGTLTLFTGDTATLTATVQPDSATNKNVTWSSDNEAVATVDNSGKITAVTAGEANITVKTEDGNHSADCKVTVTQSAYSISADTTALNFGSVYTGYTQPAAQTVTITNTGNQPLTLTQPASTSSFVVGTLSTTSLPVNGTAAFTVQPKAGLAVDTYSENIAVTSSEGATATISATFTVRQYSGGSSDPTYSITLPSRVTGGELKLSRRYAEKGETVTLTAIPDEGYELDTLTVTDSKGKEIELTHKGGNEYTFKMPAGRVEIEVSFRESEIELPFTDVPEGAWYEDAAAYVYEHGLMAGTSATTFAPDATTSRSMIATILWRMAGSPVVNYAMDYTDVAQGQWYSEAIRWAASEGIVGGYGNGLFGTNDPITREQFAAMLYRFAQEQGYDVSIGENTNILSYTDVADLSEYAISAMQWAVGAGIINGTGDGSTLSPQGQATRAQAAVMLMRFCEEYVTW